MSATISSEAPSLTETEKTKCHLLNLPAELRLTIYEFYFAHTNLIVPKTINIIEGELFTWTSPTQDLAEPALLSTSSQLRSEALKPYIKELREASEALDCKSKHVFDPNLPDWHGGWYRHYLYHQVLLGDKARVVKQKIKDLEEEMEGAGQSHA
ncbi:hypothetical protein CLAFUW4_14142 [Fulvia fulva]|uniref:Uncharacterized protein n=1 Tax=Passalora fulva TaxID=5499 RepID=A0A9Q8UW40_PASFU|nr:uncharacterized protein CLAFUR5_13976 [Fulvia fulva]KAK4610585.1 hypothetical protein CLAFUR4_14145 [Fulvia fulva]KAK4610961.1 hypothetical protein CLAFUR0_14149 [Fulvia fulva]UJO24580.1 hypothetical protein CLAFUR5_13976 [Fulvia fulva]WPV22311.1 hypothetical protein CLAFUW4_14142 [Fulvia fulva]WPV37187.1 hypothetical protein CLAFUW7_14153 [Fulvia fulva]